ncbi:MAG: 3-oxoacyl-[acyl-carrier-protein] synthase III C-terminal domain-containing protein, partial [Olsenella profusa]
ALDLANRKWELKRGDLIALVGYGAGLAVNSCLFRWDMDSVV